MLELFVSYKQFAEAIEPAMGDLHDPASGFLFWILSQTARLLSTPPEVGDIAMTFDDLKCGYAGVGRISAQMLAAPDSRCGPLELNGIEHRFKLADIMTVRPGEDK